MPRHRGNHDPSPATSWRFTKVMNMSDLSRDDDFLSHLFVEKLGTGSVPLFVHKMDSSRRLPKTDTNDILQIVRRVRLALPITLVLRSHSCGHKAGCDEGPTIGGDSRSGRKFASVRSPCQPPTASWFSYLLLYRIRPIRYYLSGYMEKQVNAFATYVARANPQQLEP